MPNSLPIEAIKSAFLSALHTESTIVLSAPPGAGKSTRLPLWLLELPQFANQKIYLLQPRRIAAKNIACFLAKQLNEPVGQSVGYRLRNDTKVSAHTKLEVITEGILTQIIQTDPELSNCHLIIFDEFHERSTQGDLAFALAREVQQELRDDLKIALMSATIATEHLLEKLPDAVPLSSEGRSYPVEISYCPATDTKQWRNHALKVIKQQASSHQGSILVFLPGVADIRYLATQLIDELPHSIQLSPLYGELTISEQQQAIAPAKSGINKLVLATNIAETSLTIEGINLVIDCGLEKVALYDQQTMTNRLQQQAISKASATQRTGRAGRLMSGKCIRLFGGEEYERRREHNISEIQLADLLPLLIESARWGARTLADLPFLEYPAVQKENIAWQELEHLAIVDKQNRLSTHGQQVAKLACHPRFAHMIITAKQLEAHGKSAHLTMLACLMTALLEERDIMRGELARFDCDFRHRIIELIKNQGKYASIIKQAKLLASKVGSQFSINLPIEYAGVLLSLAYPERIAKCRNRQGEYLTRQGKGISMAIEDALSSEPYLVCAQTSQYQQQTKVRLAAPLDISLLIRWNIVTVNEVLHVGYDNSLHRIIAKQQTKLGAIILDEKTTSNQLTREQIAEMWTEQLQNNGLTFLPWQEQDKALLTRMRWLKQHQSQLTLPDLSDTALLNNLAEWFTPFVGDIKTKAQLKKLDLCQLLLSLFTYQQQQQLARYAPTSFTGPTGRKCPIRYNEQRSPTVSLPMQELYGVNITPCVGDSSSQHSIALIIELLSPAKRPIQITQDLVKFWQGSYKAVQKDMKSQYPKHYWPDDPANAQATNKVKKHLKDI